MLLSLIYISNICLPFNLFLNCHDVAGTTEIQVFHLFFGQLLWFRGLLFDRPLSKVVVVTNTRNRHNTLTWTLVRHGWSFITYVWSSQQNNSSSLGNNSETNSHRQPCCLSSMSLYLVLCWPITSEKKQTYFTFTNCNGFYISFFWKKRKKKTVTFMKKKSCCPWLLVP